MISTYARKSIKTFLDFRKPQGNHTSVEPSMHPNPVPVKTHFTFSSSRGPNRTIRQNTAGNRILFVFCLVKPFLLLARLIISSRPAQTAAAMDLTAGRGGASLGDRMTKRGMERTEKGWRGMVLDVVVWMEKEG